MLTFPFRYYLTNTGGGTLDFGANNVTLSGTATQNIAGFSTTGLVSMTKTGGTATLTGNVNGGNLTINGTGGTLNLGAGLTHTFTGTWTRTAGTPERWLEYAKDRRERERDGRNLLRWQVREPWNIFLWLSTFYTLMCSMVPLNSRNTPPNSRIRFTAGKRMIQNMEQWLGQGHHPGNGGSQ